MPVIHRTDVLTKAKENLITRTAYIYLEMRHDHPTTQYPGHFKSMGEIIAKIDRFEDLPSLMRAVCGYEFDILGIACADSIQEFFEEIFK